MTIWRTRLFKNTFVYTIANMLDRAIPFLLLPILTSYLSPYDYGLITLFTLLYSFLLPLVGVETRASIARLYFDHDDRTFPILLWNSIVLCLIGTVIVAPLIPSLRFGLAYFQVNSPNLWWVLLLYCLSQSIIFLGLAVVRAQMKPVRYLLLQVGQTFFNFSLSFILIVFIGWKWEGRIFGTVLSSCFFAGLTLALLRKWNLIRPRLSRSDMRSLIHYGLPLIPHAIGGSLLALSDRLMITSLTSLEQAGIYAVGAQIGMVIQLLADSFNRAFAPWLFEKLKKDDPVEKRRIVGFTYVYFVGALVAAGLIALLAPILVHTLIGPSFKSSVQYIPWIALAGAFNGMYYMVTNYLFYAKKTGALAKITISCGLINLGINYLLISSMGPIGGAIATAFTAFIFFLSTWVSVKKAVHMPWRKPLFSYNRPPR